MRKKFLSLYQALIGNEKVIKGPTPPIVVEEAKLPEPALPKISIKKQKLTEPPSAVPIPKSTTIKAPRIVLKEKYLSCLEAVKQHFVMGLYGKVFTADPFLLAVDPTKYLGYIDVRINIFMELHNYSFVS